MKSMGRSFYLPYPCWELLRSPSKTPHRQPEEATSHRVRGEACLVLTIR